jgi:hypothetical protein
MRLIVRNLYVLIDYWAVLIIQWYQLFRLVFPFSGPSKEGEGVGGIYFFLSGER